MIDHSRTTDHQLIADVERLRARVAELEREQRLLATFDHSAVDITERKRVEEERAAREQQRVLSQHLLEAQERERRKIARELHDETGQSLTALKINLHTLRTLVDQPASGQRLDESIAIVDRLLEQVRALSLDLRPSVLDDLGLAAALEWYIGRLAQRSGLAAEFANTLGERVVPPSIATACFRIAQEALTNAVRHACARRLTVMVGATGCTLTLEIRDDGQGFDVSGAHMRTVGGSSLGLLNMAERAELAGGRLTIESIPHQGTAVRAWFPLCDPSLAATASKRREP